MSLCRLQTRLHQADRMVLPERIELTPAKANTRKSLRFLPAYDGVCSNEL
jgi:hypothetical protein